MPDSTINIQFTGRDDSNDNSAKDMTIFSGTPKEYYNFICELEQFTEENVPDAHVQISAKVGGMPVSLEKLLGTVHLLIYETNGRSYHHLLPPLLAKYKEKFTEWAINNNIPYQ